MPMIRLRKPTIILLLSIVSLYLAYYEFHHHTCHGSPCFTSPLGGGGIACYADNTCSINLHLVELLLYVGTILLGTSIALFCLKKRTRQK